MPACGSDLPPPPSPPTEGDEAAFQERLVALQPRLRSFALALLHGYGPRAMREVDDVVQGAYRRALQAREHAPPPETGEFVSWVLGHVMNAVRDRKNKYLAPERIGRGEWLQDPEDTRWQPALQKLEVRELLQAILIAAARLPTLERQAFLAYYRVGLPPDEIARRYDTTQTAVESRIQRGRERVLRQLKGEGWSL